MAMLLSRFSSMVQLRDKRPFLLEYRSATWFIVATVSTAIFTDVFLYAVIVPVFPFSLVDRNGVHGDDVQRWVSILLSCYSAGLLVAAPIVGYFSDRITHRKGPLLFGMVVITGATVMLCLARSLPLLVAGRVLQGAAAGVIWVVGPALLADTVGRDNAGHAMGYVGTAYSTSGLIAPLLGGIVYDKAGYYAVFGMALGMCVLDIILRLLLVEKKAAVKWLENNGAQALPSPEEPKLRSSAPIPDIDDNSAAIVGNTTNVEQQKKHPSPFLTLMKSRRFQTAFWAGTVDSMIFTGLDVVLPLFVADTFQWNSLGAGLVFLSVLAPVFVQPFWGWLVDQYGPRLPAFVGAIIMIAPFVLLRLITHNSLPQKVLLCFFLALVGLGASLNLAAVMAEFTYVCADKEKRQPGIMGKGGAYATSYSFFNISWAAGGLVGAYWAGGIRASAGWGTMTWTFALVIVIISVPTLLFCGGSIWKEGLITRRATEHVAEGNEQSQMKKTGQEEVQHSTSTQVLAANEHDRQVTLEEESAPNNEPVIAEAKQ